MPKLSPLSAWGIGGLRSVNGGAPVVYRPSKDRIHPCPTPPIGQPGTTVCPTWSRRNGTEALYCTKYLLSVVTSGESGVARMERQKGGLQFYWIRVGKGTNSHWKVPRLRPPTILDDLSTKNSPTPLSRTLHCVPEWTTTKMAPRPDHFPWFIIRDDLISRINAQIQQLNCTRRSTYSSRRKPL